MHALRPRLQVCLTPVSAHAVQPPAIAGDDCFNNGGDGDSGSVYAWNTKMIMLQELLMLEPWRAGRRRLMLTELLLRR